METERLPSSDGGEPERPSADVVRDRSRHPSLQRRTLVRVFLVILMLWLLGAGYLIYDAQHHARNAEAPLRRVSELAGDDLSEVDFASVEVDLDEATSELGEGRSSIMSPLVRALAPLPVIGRQLESARALIVTSDDLATSLLPLVGSARAAQDDPNALDRVSFLEDTTDQLVELQEVVAAVDLGPSQNLVAPLAEARAELVEQLAKLNEDAASYELITTGLATFFGDSTYLVLGSNNAEMQLGGGMHLSVGRVAVLDGDLDLPGLEPSSDFFPVEATPVVDPDVQARWGFLKPSNDYRKLNYSARFADFGGPQALDMWEIQTGERLDGVLSIDPFVLDALLSVIGDVEIDNETYGAGETLIYLLQDQYDVFDSGEAAGGSDLRAERQDRLSQIAKAAVDRLATSSWDPIELIEALRPMARGRHLLAYSERPEEQAAWTALGVDGAVPYNGTGVSLINDGGTKLDPFMAISVGATFDDVDGERIVNYDVEVANEAPAEGLPRYTVGPWRSLGLAVPGTYSGRLAIYAPGYANDAGFVGPVELSASGPDGELLLNATTRWTIEPGASRTFRFQFRLPLETPSLRLIPSARFPATTWTWDGTDLTDEVAVDLE